MGKAIDKLAAAGNKFAGSVKEAVGKATHNDRMVVDGKTQKVKGTAQDVGGSIKGALGDDV